MRLLVGDRRITGCAMVDWPPRVLSTIYRHRLQTLYDLVIDLVIKASFVTKQSRGSETAEEVGTQHEPHCSNADSRPSCHLHTTQLRVEAEMRLIREGDPSEYLTLLKSCYAVMSDMAPTLGPVSFEQRWTQEQIVERVIMLQFRQETKYSHVLCSGYRKLRPSTVDSRQRRAPQGLECVCQNSSVEIVNSHNWTILLSRVGDLIMLHLLSYAAIFSPLPNNCFIQISGVAAHLSASQSWKSPSLHPGEKMLGGIASIKSISKHGTIQEKSTVRNMGLPGVAYECEDQVSHGEQRTFMCKNCGLEGSYSDCAMDEGNFVRKRQKCRHHEESSLNSGALEHETRKTLDCCTCTSTTKGFVVSGVNPSKANCPNLHSKRKNREETHFRDSGVNKVLVRSEDWPRVSGKRQKDMPCQQHTTREMSLVPLSESSKLTKVSNQSVGHERRSMKDKVVSTNEDMPGDQVACNTLQRVADASSSGKRVRLPSWKRRKLRQVQSRPETLCKDQQGVGIPEIQEPLEEQQDNLTIRRYDESHTRVFGLHQSEALGSADFCGSTPGNETAAGSTDAKKVPQGRRKPKNILRTSCGVSQRLIDRAPLFYNANFSCHPGLPVKHILNTTKPNDTGVCHLFSTIFGSDSNISVCPSSGNHFYEKYSRSKLKPGPCTHSKFIHKLLKQLLSNARRCSFARLLGRHCPLPEGWFHTVSDPLLLQSQTVETDEQGSNPVKHRHEDEQELDTDSGPVEEIMRLWLGSSYEPRSVATTIEKGLKSTSTVRQETLDSCKEVLKQNNQQRPVAGCLPQKKERRGKSNTVECPLSTDVNARSIQSELISCCTEHSKVVAFLWAVCRSIIPRDMLGSLRSWRSLRSSIAHFVGLRRHEKFKLQHALFRLQVSSFSWLSFQCDSVDSKVPLVPRRFTGKERQQQQERLELWLYWLFRDLLVPTIRANFYVTENENHRQNIFYYRKPVWARIQSKGLKELIQGNYKKLSRQAVAQMLNSRVLGFSQIRLLPKRSGLRPIANLAATSQGTLKFSVQVKRQPTLHQVFGGIVLSSPNFIRGDQKLLSDNEPPHQFEGLSCGQEASMEIIQRPSRNDKQDTAASIYSVDVCSNRNRAGAKSACGRTASEHKGSPEGFIVQMRHKKSIHFSFRSINSALRDAHCCLKLEKELHPDDLGSSVFGYCDIHAKVLPFILQLKGSLNGMPRLFMAVCDVTKAYETIQQEKLLNIVQQFVESPKYNVARYTCITPTLASFRVTHGRACTPTDKSHNFVDSLYELAVKRSHCIFTDQALSTSIKREQVLGILAEHVKQNIVQIGAQFYQQTVGIPQGSVLSSLLCSLFYGHFDVGGLLPLLQSHSGETSKHFSDQVIPEGIEQIAESNSGLTLSVHKSTGLVECDIERLLESSLKIADNVGNQPLAVKPSLEKGVTFARLNCLEPPNSLNDKNNHLHLDTTYPCEEADTSNTGTLLLRLIDDSLLISTSEAVARTFVKSMHGGSKEYGCQANKRKTAVSFLLKLEDEVLPRKVYKSEDGACFMQWSGLLINCYTLEFQADYTRYCGEHIRSTLTVKMERSQGWHLVIKMCQYMRPKCHALLFDPRINSPATICLNAFQAFLLCAMKFHAYVCCLRRRTGSNQPFLYQAIGCATRYMHSLLKHRMDTVGADARIHFPYRQLEWLALVAFSRVLKRKQSRYQILLKMLQTQLQAKKFDNIRASIHLVSATDERRSSMFKLIKY